MFDVLAFPSAHPIPLMTSPPPQHRYARQQQFAPIGPEGQQRIADADITLLGCGALGTVAAEILARAGVGRLRLIDRDTVEWTNLQRQALFDEQDAREGRAKAAAAAERLNEINSTIEIEPVVADVVAENIRRLLEGTDLVIDASDNFALRFLLNDWSLASGTPWVHGGCVGAIGQMRLFRGDGAPCFRCLIPEPPPLGAVETCDTAGVIGSATHLIASLQATEAIKWVSGNRDAVSEQLISIDLWSHRVRQLSIEAAGSEKCPACHHHRFEFLDQSRCAPGDGAAVLCGRDAVQLGGGASDAVDLAAVAEKWRSAAKVQSTPFFVRLFPSDRHTLTLFRDGRAVITGTREITEARSIYERFVG